MRGGGNEGFLTQGDDVQSLFDKYPGLMGTWCKVLAIGDALHKN